MNDEPDNALFFYSFILQLCVTMDSGVDTCDLRKITPPSRLNRSGDAERFRYDELLMDLEHLSRKCARLESDKDDLEAQLRQSQQPNPSPDNCRNYFRLLLVGP